jgi:hypothetical protein
MAEANVSQLAKLLSAVMEYEDLPVEIHNAIADWSCPCGRVTNSPELFELILADRKAHPEDYEDIPKLSHPVYPGEGPKLVPAEKAAPQSQPADRCQAEDLAVTVAAVLKNSACPEKLYNAIAEALSEIETHADTLSVDFLFGLFLSKPRQAKEAEGGAQ